MDAMQLKRTPYSFRLYLLIPIVTNAISTFLLEQVCRYFFANTIKRSSGNTLVPVPASNGLGIGKVSADDMELLLSAEAPESVGLGGVSHSGENPDMVDSKAL